MALVDVTPVTAHGECGVVRILDERNVAAWVAAHCAELIAEGYVHLSVTPHLTHNGRMIRRMGGQA